MITVNNLVYTYPGGTAPAVKGISFKVAPAEIYGFLGPSGAGKSTTQKVLIRLLRGYKGDIQVLDKALNRWEHNYYDSVGVGFELPNHYTRLTALENLQFFASFYNVPTRDPMQLLEMVGLEKDADKKVENYSKGMKMRLNFVRALLNDPKLLFLDEPTSGLDPVNARIMKDIIQELRREGKTIFLTTHNMHDADELCDHVAFMVDGQIQCSGSPRELKLQHGQRSLNVEYREDGRLLAADYPLDGLGGNDSFLQLLREKDVQAMHSREATLEDIFIKETGRSLS